MISRWLWPALVVATLAATYTIDRTLWPDRLAIELYAIPVLLSAKDWSPKAVFGVTIASLIVATHDLYMAHQTTLYAATGLAGLLIVGLLTTFHTFRRQEDRVRIERQQAMIDAVERLRQPLTVILGYSQVIEAKAPSDTILVKAATSVRRAALDLRNMLNEILEKCVPS